MARRNQNDWQSDAQFQLSGDDALTLPVLSVGGVGVISVTANLLPKETSEVVRLWNAGKIAEARALHLRLLPVHESMFIEANPGPVKAAMAAESRLADSGLRAKG